MSRRYYAVTPIGIPLRDISGNTAKECWMRLRNLLRAMPITARHLKKRGFTVELLEIAS